ncbi:hypothetical protein VE03_09475 [Pseudogymnoascus sp. 23342-1-I1]|nr:hypothetical protein VE03_09475 [Pseudogymnoascus sp. 23342-1-I1]
MSSDDYAPGNDALLSVDEARVQLSQRDLSLSIPINFKTVPGVSLSAACFGDRVIGEGELARCFSNLLSVGFRRFELDLYWDAGRSLWSFCPVEMQQMPGGESTSSSQSLTASPTTSNPGSLSFPTGVASSIPGQGTNGALPVSGTSEGASASPVPTPSSEPLLAQGAYKCSPAATLETFGHQLHSYLVDTQNTLAAQVSYYVFNIHAAASASSPGSPAQAPTNLPVDGELIGGMLSGNLSSYIYTPVNLSTNRANLNSSWYTVPERYRPVTDYYSIHVDDNGVWATDDGWPSESFIEFSNLKRILFQFGTIDPQMQGADYGPDADILFPPGYLTSPQPGVSLNSSGDLHSGCYLHSSPATPSNTNSSWATYALTTLPTTNTTTTTSLTTCGISPHLNTTLTAPASTSPFPYHSFALSTHWSWAPSEPRNFSTTLSPANADLMRCASVSPTGTWSVTSCAEKHFVACRASPFNWTISTKSVALPYAPSACPRGTAFAAPASALENAYLAQAQRASPRDYEGLGVMVAFNSVQVDGCWVVGGADAVCPYDRVTLLSFAREREIVVPTVAAVIVLVISALTVFSKVAGNRRVGRGRRGRERGGGWRAANGFVYEGVPS